MSDFDPIVVPLHPTPSFRLRLALNHVLGGVVLALTGAEALLAGEVALLPVAEVVAGALVLIAVAREVRSPEHGHGAVAWVEIFAGVMLAVEGAHHWHPGGWFQPGFFYFLLAAFTLAVGIGLVRPGRKRELRIDARGFDLRASRRLRLACAWSDVAALTTTGREVRVTTRSGGVRRLDLGPIANRVQALAALESAARTHVPPPAPPEPAAPDPGA